MYGEIKISIKFIETHAHLDMIEKKTEKVIKDALENGVIKIVTIGVDLKSSKNNIYYASKFNNVYTAIGFHPHESKNIKEGDYDILEKLLLNSKNVAVGEIGLDYYYNHSKKEEQQKAFREQIDLAKRYDLPIIIHNREAHEDTMRILKEKGKGMKVVLHCFSGDIDMAQWCLKQGYYFGIGGVVTFKNAQKLIKIVKDIPLNNLLLETDSPFLTPSPYRGKINEPKYIPLIAQKIAELKNKKISEIAKKTTFNAEKFFGI